jgi:pyrrolysyl-tRNA synthetase-like protein
VGKDSPKIDGPLETDHSTSGDRKKKAPPKRYYRKRVELFPLIDKIKLWPSRTGVLHGIRSIEKSGDTALITTHCNKCFRVNNSRNSRAARWLRNKWYHDICAACGVPDWKIEKYGATRFHRHHGSALVSGAEPSREKRP